MFFSMKVVIPSVIYLLADDCFYMIVTCHSSLKNEISILLVNLEGIVCDCAVAILMYITKDDAF